MTTQVDYYELLGCTRDADAGTIKSAYRRLAINLHPDKHGGCKEHEAKFKAVNEAYDCLKDPQKRAAYDRFGHAARSEEHTSELQSLMRISYAVFCLKKKKQIKQNDTTKTLAKNRLTTNTII